MRIAIVAHNALGALRAGVGRHIGGIERQVSLMSRWLAAQGHEVSLLVWDEGQPRGLEVDGVKIIAICRREDGLPGVRFFHPRWSGLVKALAGARADLYYHNGGEYVTGQVGMWCRANGRPFVFSLASDGDCSLDRMKKWRERQLYRHGLKVADRVIAQTHSQAQLFRANFGREAEVLPMGATDPVSHGAALVAERQWQQFRVCWVGRVARVKRLELLLDVAERCSNVQFDVVASPDQDAAYERELAARGRSLRNVVWHGRLSPAEVGALYQRAALLCCTSVYEGFPNTFLECWALGIPVVSTFDPDGLLANEGLGVPVQPDPAAFEAALAGFRTDRDSWNAAGARARAYFVGQHSADAAFSRFETMFKSVLAMRAA